MTFPGTLPTVASEAGDAAVATGSATVGVPGVETGVAGTVTRAAVDTAADVCAAAAVPGDETTAFETGAAAAAGVGTEVDAERSFTAAALPACGAFALLLLLLPVEEALLAKDSSASKK